MFTKVHLVFPGTWQVHYPKHLGQLGTVYLWIYSVSAYDIEIRNLWVSDHLLENSLFSMPLEVIINHSSFGTTLYNLLVKYIVN